MADGGRTSSRPANRLLASLTPLSLARLTPHLRTIDVSPRQSMIQPSQRVRSVFFPNCGVFSLVKPLAEGSTVEVLSIGNEGMLGIEAFFDESAIALAEIRLQVPADRTTVEALDVGVFRRELVRDDQLLAVVRRYLHLVLATATQAAACSATHSLSQRCCRWLLATHDRLSSPRFHVTQEFLAAMLGARRPTITAIARELQRSGLIRYWRGVVTIVDRRGLELCTCECYEAVKRFSTTLR